MAGFLYRYEAKSIQTYVLATGRVAEIAGASARVESLGALAERVVGELAAGGSEVIARGAGSATVRFPDGEALAEFAGSWPLIVDQEVPGLRVVQAWVSDEVANGPEELFGRIQRLSNVHQAELPEAGPLVARSGRTGGAAVGKDRRGGGLQDRETRAKERLGRRGDLLARRLLGDGARVRFVRNHDDEFRGPGEDGEEGPVAVVHVDGNDMGTLVRELGGNLEAYRRFSRALSEATEEAAKAIAKWLVERYAKECANGVDAEHENVIPARPVVIGGDDVTWVVRGEDAVEFVRRFVREFERRTADRAQAFGSRGRATVCAGIAFVHRNAPFVHAYELSGALCKEAKRRLRGLGEKGVTPSGVMFHRVTTSDLAEWSDIRDRELSCEAGSMVFGPYLVGESEGAGGNAPAPRLEDLLRLAQGLQLLPRGPRREWLRKIKTDPLRAQHLWERMRQVVAGRGAWKRFAESLERLGVDPATGWRDDAEGESGPGGMRRTPVLDAHTLGVVGCVSPEPPAHGEVARRAFGGQES